MKLGVCYYPEHWPEGEWVENARRMRAMGISRVRIGEFAWSRIEPDPGRFDWVWLDRAIEVLAEAGLDIVMCTPTATPPKWLIDRHPDILAHDVDGRPRRFGSRRHYCFSSRTYRAESERITRAVGERYGRHPAVAAWQTDNEYGCHDTVVSYSPEAARAFRSWLERRYKEIASLNAAWGGVFWSQEYRSFDEVDPPLRAVTEGSPSHILDFRRFASDEVRSFNREQVDILRQCSPGRDILHNYMGVSTGFDHFDVAKDLDVATWDSYPLGFLEQGSWSDDVKSRFMRQGHPDFTAFHHDLYRGVGAGRWWVMEQQPGPVNWAPWNPAPLPGMVRTWTLEAYAHGAEVVSYFRWRQAPFAQEQMHAGLLRPNGSDAPAAREVAQVASELELLGEQTTRRGQVALLFDYAAQWLLETQPQGRDFRYFDLVLEFYAVARRLGLDVDVVSPHADLADYQLVLAPSLPILSQQLVDKLGAGDAQVVFGPRTGSRTEAMHIPADLPPGLLHALIPIRVARVESLRAGWSEPGAFPATRWLEHVETDLTPRASTDSGHGLWFDTGRVQYLATWPDEGLLESALTDAASRAGLEVRSLPDGLRLRRCGDLQFAFNYAPEAADLADHLTEAAGFDFVLGGTQLEPGGVAAWRAS